MKRTTLLPIIATAITLLCFGSCEQLDEITGASKKPGKISGVVTDSITNVGISGVAVSTLPPTTTAETDNDGVYILSSVDKGDYTVRFIKPDYTTKTITTSVAADKNTTVNAVLSPTVLPVGSIEGTVTSTVDSTPVAGASITTDPATQTVTTNSQGKFTLSNVVVRSYQVHVTAAGYQSVSQNVQVNAGVTSSITIRLMPQQTIQNGTIKGKVTNASDNSTIADADITTSPATKTVKTDANGNYELTDIPAGTYTVTAVKSGFSNASVTSVALTAGEIKTVNLQMSPLGAGTGQLRVNLSITFQAVTVPAPGVTVTLLQINSAQISDTNGIALFTNVPFGQYTVRCEHPELITEERQVTISSSNLVELSISMSIRQDLPGAIQGTVLDGPTRGPIQNATVVITTANGLSTVTNASGEFTFNSVPAGLHSVTASTNDGAYESKTLQTTVFSSQTTTLEFVLTPVATNKGNIRGTVLDNTGKPMMAQMKLTGPQSATTQTNSAGTYNFLDIAFGTYEVEAEASGYVTQKKNVTLSSVNRDVEVNFTLVSSGSNQVSVSGKTYSIASMKGVSNTTISTVPSTSIVTSSGDGTYKINNVNPGTYTFNLSHAKYIDYTIPTITVPNQSGYTLDLIMFYGKYTSEQVAYYPLVTTWQEWLNNYWGSAGKLFNFGTVPAYNRFDNGDHARLFPRGTYMQTEAISSISDKDPVMISCWVKLPPVITGSNPIFSWTNADETSGWFLTVESEEGKLKFQITANSGNGLYTLFDPVYDNDILDKWIMVTAGMQKTSDDTYQVVLYVNDTKRLSQDSKFAEIKHTGDRLKIGRVRMYGNYLSYSGIIDDIRIFKNFLTDANVADLLKEE